MAKKKLMTRLEMMGKIHRLQKSAAAGEGRRTRLAGNVQDLIDERGEYIDTMLAEMRDQKKELEDEVLRQEKEIDKYKKAFEKESRFSKELAALSVTLHRSLQANKKEEGDAGDDLRGAS